jgi:hypothetical protein
MCLGRRLLLASRKSGIYLPEELCCPLRPQRSGHGLQGRKKRAFLERGRSSTKLSFQHLCPQRRTERDSPSRQLLSTPTSFSSGGLESPPIFDDEPTVQGEEPPQREAWRRRNRHQNIRRHHEAGEQDPAQPVSRDEVSKVGETPRRVGIPRKAEFSPT